MCKPEGGVLLLAQLQLTNLAFMFNSRFNFKVLDVDGSGFVDVDDMRLLFPNNTLEELGSMMREVNPEGRLTFQEFLGAMQK